VTRPYPLGLLLAGRRVLVVGGGAVATRRVPALLDAEADVVVVSPAVTPALHGLAVAGRLRWVKRRFEASDVDGAWLVHVAVDDPAAAAQVSAAAEARRVFCVRADDRHAASAWTPATTRHGRVTVAVTAGGDHRRAVIVRDAVDALLCAQAGLVESDDPAGDDAPLLAAPADDADRRGSVALVGGGPGDPELITVKGRRLLATADVVVVDRLAPGLLLDELRPEVLLIDASKIPYGPGSTQDQINRVLVEHALAGRFVVRLKGGDPFVFGRGGEEVLACASAGVPVVVVPGVTSAVAAPAAGGVPVTHRGVAHEFVVVSGHLPPGHPESLVDWSTLGRLRGTVCVLMGLRNLAAIADTLMGAGRAPVTPVAVIQDGTTRAQRAIRTTLARAAADAAAEGLRPPAVIVIGEVAHVLTS
jgi:uroporphyrin-III C-methyltransferase/precorrin-2 dehydrogenase/sirohydrochlorin ferrochelatase